MPSHLFAAKGAALNAKEECSFTLDDLLKEFESDIQLAVEVERMEPLFKDEKEYDEFIEEHNQFKVKKADLATYSGKCYLGIDAGSTTTKQVQGKRRSCSGRGRFAGRGKGGMVQWNKHGAVKGARQDAGSSRDCGQC